MQVLGYTPITEDEKAMTARIVIKGLDELAVKFDKIGQLDGVKAAMKNAGDHLKGEISIYPGRKHVTIQSMGGWKSDKQRRFFFAALRSGDIQVPYRRGQSPGSEDLGQRWTVATRKQGLEVIVGNNASYGPFVQSHDGQSKMMKVIGWKTDQQVLDENKGKVVEYIRDAIVKIINS